MENLQDSGNFELDREQRRDFGSTSTSSSSSSVYRLFGRQKPIHQVMGGGKAADVILWKRWLVSCGVIVIATIAWLLFERSGLPFLAICSDVLLILVVVRFLQANYAVMRNRQLQELPELVLSEELVISAAASFRVKVNNILLMTHDITLGKDFKLFFMVVVCLWLFSIVGSLLSFFTLAYIGIIISVTLPALYSRYEEQVDSFAGFIQQRFSRPYKIVDENVVRRQPQGLLKDKDE